MTKDEFFSVADYGEYRSVRCTWSDVLYSGVIEWHYITDTYFTFRTREDSRIALRWVDVVWIG